MALSISAVMVELGLRIPSRSTGKCCRSSCVRHRRLSMACVGPRIASTAFEAGGVIPKLEIRRPSLEVISESHRSPRTTAFQEWTHHQGEGRFPKMGRQCAKPSAVPLLCLRGRLEAFK